jgi:signal peptidase I
MNSSSPIKPFDKPSDNNRKNDSKSQSTGALVRELIKVAVIAAITIIGVRELLFKPFYVEGQSMVPNFQPNQYLIIDELTYRFREPERGEVIVFKHTDGQYLLKRVIGLPGERIKVGDGKITIYNDAHPEGLKLDETYLPDDLQTTGEEIVTLEKTQYFVLGDNRPNSLDSRRFGPISKNQMVGRVFFRGWPFDQVAVFKTPQFNQ